MGHIHMLQLTRIQSSQSLSWCLNAVKMQQMGLNEEYNVKCGAYTVTL